MNGQQPTFTFTPPAPVVEVPVKSQGLTTTSSVCEVASVPVNSRKYMIAIWVLVALLVMIFVWSYCKSRQTDSQIKSMGESLAGRMRELVPSQSDIEQQTSHLVRLEGQSESL